MPRPLVYLPAALVNLARALLLLAAVVVPGVAAAQTGTVTGTVRNAVTMLPVANMDVFVYTASVQIVGNATTNASGVYNIPNVPVGNYFVIAYPSSGTLLPEVFPDVHCSSGCNYLHEFTSGTPFVVTSGGIVTRNFFLDEAGTISGTVTDAASGTPLQNISVTIWARFGTLALPFSSDTTDASGIFTVPLLAPGTYYATTSNSAGFVNEVYDNTRCAPSCSDAAILAGTPIAVTAGTTTPGRNFALDLGGRVTGSITSVAIGAPIQGVTVNVSTQIGGTTFSAGSAQTDATGTYTVIGLPTGTYAAHTSNNLGFMNEIYDDVLCPLTCSTTTAAQSGAAIPVTLGATTSGRNFALAQGGNLSGTVLNQTTSLPIANVTVTAVLRVDGAIFTASASTNAAGNYTITGLPTGSYRLMTSNSQGFINEIYDNLQCRGSCTSTNAATLGSPVAVTAGATTTGNDFALQPGGSVSGTIVDTRTGAFAGGVTVRAHTVVAGVLTLAGSGSTNASGVYTIPGLLTGTYFVSTSGNHGWRNEVYDNVPCIGTTCSDALIATGTAVPVTVGAVSPGRNFSLGFGDLLQGRVTETGTGNPIAFATVSYIHSPSGVQVASVFTAANGVYTVPALPNGTYVAFTSDGTGHVNEIYDNIRCATTCSVATALASGTPITVTAAGALTGDDPSLVAALNFVLDVRNEPPAAPTNFRASVANGTAQFSWVPPTPGVTGVATSYVIDAGLSPGGTILSIPVNGTSHTTGGVPPGVYYVRVRAINAFGSSPPSTEVVLVVGGGATALPEPPTSVVAFMSGNRLTMTWAAAASGGPSSSFLVEAGSASGAANLATLAVAGRSFTFVPVPSGFYFLRVRAVNVAGVSRPSAETMIVVGGVASPPGAPNFSSHTVSNGTVTLNWQAPTFGTATSYIVEAGSATGLANLAVANVGNTLTVSFNGVPSGTYFVRVRGVNVLGAGVVSNERTVVVP